MTPRRLARRFVVRRPGNPQAEEMPDVYVPASPPVVRAPPVVARRPGPARSFEVVRPRTEADYTRPSAEELAWLNADAVERARAAIPEEDVRLPYADAELAADRAAARGPAIPAEDVIGEDPELAADRAMVAAARAAPSMARGSKGAGLGRQEDARRDEGDAKGDDPTLAAPGSPSAADEAALLSVAEDPLGEALAPRASMAPRAPHVPPTAPRREALARALTEPSEPVAPAGGTPRLEDALMSEVEAPMSRVPPSPAPVDGPVSRAPVPVDGPMSFEPAPIDPREAGREAEYLDARRPASAAMLAALADAARNRSARARTAEPVTGPAATPLTAAPPSRRTLAEVLSPEEAEASLFGLEGPVESRSGSARLWEPRPTVPRRRGPSLAPAPALSEDELSIEALTGRPRDAPSLVPYDSRGESGLDRDLRLNADSTRIEARRAELAGRTAAEQRDVFEAQITAQQELEAERRTATAAAQQSFRHFADRAASLTIDPDGFYHSRGVGGTIASAVAIGLGGLSSAINGGPNVALEMINSEIDRDLMAQQQRIELAFRRADAEGTLYDMARQEYQDRSAALEASRALALDNVAATVAEDASRLGSEEARVNGEAMAAQLRDAANAARAEAERAEVEWQFNMQLLDARGRRESARADQDALRAGRMAAGPGGPAEPNPVTERQMNAYNRALDSGMDPADAALTAGIDPRVLPGGGRRFAEGSGDAAAGTVAAISSALDTLETLIPGGLDSEEDIPGVGLVDNAVPDLLTSEEGQALREELANTTELFGRLHSGAAITDEEFALFTRIIRGANTEAALRRGIRRIRREIDARTSPVREGRGLEDVEAAAVSDLGAREVAD